MLCQYLKQSAIILFGLLLVSCAGSQYSVKKPPTTNKTANRIYTNLSQYQRLARLDWRPIVLKRLPLKPRQENQEVPFIRERLILLGDLNPKFKSDNDVFDNKMKIALEQFQWRHGIQQTGIIDQQTLQAMNVTPKERLAQLKKSMDKWATFPEDIGSHYIRVNVANFDLDVIKDGNNVLNMKVIAGKPSRPTPELYSKVQTIVLNPKWNIPRNIMRKDIIPKVIKNPNYLSEENISIYSSWAKNAYTINPNDIDWLNAQNNGFKYRMSQAPGEKNALGRVKFVFLNNEDVYLHDTPQKGLFGKIQRAFSSGCVRLEKPFHLVEYFVNESGGFDHDTINEKLATGHTQYLRIKKPIPIYITYITAWVDKNGATHFREDIYKRGV